jgi:hypothetical protein
MTGTYIYKGEPCGVLGQCEVQGSMKEGILFVKKGKMKVVSYKYFLQHFKECKPITRC